MAQKCEEEIFMLNALLEECAIRNKGKFPLNDLKK